MVFKKTFFNKKFLIFLNLHLSIETSEYVIVGLFVLKIRNLTWNNSLIWRKIIPYFGKNFVFEGDIGLGYRFENSD